MRLLQDDGKFLQDSCRYSLDAVLYPSPVALPQQPIFTVDALRRIFGRRWWHPLNRIEPLQWGKHFLRQAHTQLDERDDTIALHHSFAIAQRYSAYLVEGALASAYADRSKHNQSRNRWHQRALDRFDAALALEGKSSDAVLLELKGLQLRKFGRVPDALDVLGTLETLLKERLKGVTPLQQSERRAILVQLMRVARYQSEMDHKNGQHVLANNRLLQLSQHAVAGEVFHSHLELRDRLERAQFHEVHACARVRFTAVSDGNGGFTLPVNGVAEQSLEAARRDYRSILEELEPSQWSWPIRLWRRLNRSDVKDGSSNLRAAAGQALERLDSIRAAKGCPLCSPPTVAFGDDAPKALTNSG